MTIEGHMKTIVLHRGCIGTHCSIGLTDNTPIIKGERNGKDNGDDVETW